MLRQKINRLLLRFLTQTKEDYICNKINQTFSSFLFLECVSATWIFIGGTVQMYAKKILSHPSRLTTERKKAARNAVWRKAASKNPPATMGAQETDGRVI